MLKILKSDLEAQEGSISVRIISNKPPPIRYSSSALYSGFNSVSKKCVFCDKNQFVNRCVKITVPHPRKRFETSCSEFL